MAEGPHRDRKRLFVGGMAKRIALAAHSAGWSMPQEPEVDDYRRVQGIVTGYRSQVVKEA